MKLFIIYDDPTMGDSDELPNPTSGDQVAYGTRRVMTDKSETFDVMLVCPAGKERDEISIACDDEGSAIDLLECIEMNAISSLTEVVSNED